MNELTTNTDNQSTFQAMMQIAEVLAYNELLPEHLRGRKNKAGKWEPFSEVQRRAICFSIVNAANLWSCNPFMLAEQSYSVHGKMDYSGAFYRALANTRGNLDQQLSDEYSGQGADRKIVVSGRIRGETKIRTAELTVREGKKLGNAPTWDTDPDQMLNYAASRKWVRRHCPQVLLGLVQEEEAAAAEPVENLPRIEVDVDYATEIQTAGDQDQLKAIAQRINDDAGLSNDDRQFFLQMGRDAFKALNQKPQPMVIPEEEDKGGSDAFTRWERTIKTELSQDKLIQHLDAIMEDPNVSQEEAKRLHKMINVQIAPKSEQPELIGE